MSRFQIKVDSADTQPIRKLAVALHHAGHTGELQVGVEGPECWGAKTPMLRQDEFATVIATLARENIILWPHLTV